MSNTHNNGNNDNDLESLGKAYTRLQQEEPPDLLDQAVLNRAHRAVEKKPHWMKFSWLHGLTTAAVFVLAFSLVLNQREPVPDFEAGIQSEELELNQQGTLSKKQSADEPVDSLRQQKKEKGDARYDKLRTRMAPPAVPASEPVTAAGEEPETAERLRSNYIQELRVIEPDQADEDIGEIVSGVEAEAPEMADSLADQAEAAASAPIATEPVGAALREKLAEAERDPEIEKKLKAIIELKQSGDPGWEKELASFRESYPDYPLPDELLN
jgi:hypothetical protein